jgi:hypothetical protein
VGLFQKRQELSKILFLNELYQNIINVHGIIIEFGVRWGQNVVTLSNLRGIHEPFNYSRKIIGFDTFEGFLSTHNNDGKHEVIREGAFNVSDNYQDYLNEVLAYHESESPLSHIKKYEIIKGDAVIELEKYLTNNPQTIIALAYFDFDLYEPTANCLKMIEPYLTKGSIVGFDELTDSGFPGETVALREVFGLSKSSIQRSKYSGIQSYLIY